MNKLQSLSKIFTGNKGVLKKIQNETFKYFNILIKI